MRGALYRRLRAAGRSATLAGVVGLPVAVVCFTAAARTGSGGWLVAGLVAVGPAASLAVDLVAPSVVRIRAVGR